VKESGVSDQIKSYREINGGQNSSVWRSFLLEAVSNRFRYSFICQGTSTRKQQRNLFGLRVKLPPIITRLTTQR